MKQRSLVRDSLRVLLVATVPFATVALAAPAQSQVPFEELGRAFLEAHCPDGATVEDCDLASIVQAHYVRFDLGAFELLYPATMLEEKKKASDYVEIATGILDLQSVWIDWVSEGGESADAAKADMLALKTWVEGIKPAALGKLADAEDRQLEDALGMDSSVRDASKRFTKFMKSKAELGMAPYSDKSVQVLCAPTRRNFIELLSFAGMIDERARKSYWVEGVDQWTQVWSGFTLLLALEYAPWSGFDAEFRSGLSMKKFEKTGLLEHVLQQCATAYLRYCMPRREPGPFDTAAALNLAIEVCGQCNAIDSEGQRGTSGATTRPYERFVPGGNPSGGILPKMSAAPLNTVSDNPWRKGGGADHFAQNLRKGQKDGAKTAAKDRENPQRKDKSVHFRIRDENGAGKHVVSAPFFGAAANEKQYPPFEYLNDYKEFFRSYRVGFFHWVRTQSAETPEESAAKLRGILRGLPTLSTSTTLEDLFAEQFETPLSAENGETDSLEWRYLTWLQKGK